MYSEQIKFQFKKDTLHSKRFGLIKEVFEELEKQKLDSKQIEAGGTYSYNIKHNGVVTMLS